MRTLKVDPLTRVEGHGRVELLLEQGRLSGARMAVTESPRLFEGLLVGRSWSEVPGLICRICAICSTVHRVAACQALEEALGVEIPPQAETIRELAILGGHIESHCLHLFCLVLPDLEGVDGILDLLRAGHGPARRGLALKALGNRIQKLAGGRVIHPVNIELGGVLQRPDREGLFAVREELGSWEGRLEEALAPFFGADRFPPAVDTVGTALAVEGNGNGFSLLGRKLRFGDGRILPAERYGEVLREYPVDYSNARHCQTAGAPLLTCALSRVKLSPGGSVLRRRLGAPPPGIHANNAAQAAELHWALGRAAELVADLLEADEAEPLRVPVKPRPGAGTAVIEAPRGLLIHHYVLDDLGRVAAADILTPTAINQAAMEAQILADLDGAADEAALVRDAERIVRSFDPCISCSVHLIQGSHSG